MEDSDEARIRDLEESVSELQGRVVVLMGALGIALSRLRGLKHEEFDPMDSIPIEEQLESMFSAYDLLPAEFRDDKDFARSFKEASSSLVRSARLNA